MPKAPVQEKPGAVSRMPLSTDAAERRDADVESVRTRKRRETRVRIAARGLKLFAEHGYENTTLEAVARAADVSPRTLYAYFGTKYEILMFWHDASFTAAIRPTLLREDKSRGPFAAARDCLLQLVRLYETDNLVTVDRIWNSSDTLLAQKQLIFLEIEEAVSSALGEVWPELASEGSLRIIAMMAVGAQRLAMEVGRRPGEARTLHARLEEVFELLGRQL